MASPINRGNRFNALASIAKFLKENGTKSPVRNPNIRSFNINPETNLNQDYITRHMSEREYNAETDKLRDDYNFKKVNESILNGINANRMALPDNNAVNEEIANLNRENYLQSEGAFEKINSLKAENLSQSPFENSLNNSVPKVEDNGETLSPNLTLKDSILSLLSEGKDTVSDIYDKVSDIESPFKGGWDSFAKNFQESFNKYKWQDEVQQSSQGNSEVKGSVKNNTKSPDISQGNKSITEKPSDPNNDLYIKDISGNLIENPFRTRALTKDEEEAAKKELGDFLNVKNPFFSGKFNTTVSSRPHNYFKQNR